VRRPRLVHVTTTDMSLALLLGPQLGAFADAGFEVIGASAPGSYVSQIEALGVQHISLRNTTRSMAPHRDVAAMLELRRLFVELQPDVVHTHNPKPGVYGRIAARAARVPAIVNTVHGLYALPEDPLVKRTVVYGLEAIAGRCSHAELVQNPEDLARLERLGLGPKLRLLGNGIDLARFQPARISSRDVERVRAEIGAGADDIVCGLVGRLVWEKGYHEVFEAAARLVERMPRLRFVVVGPEDTAKQDSVSRADLRKAERDANITFLGDRLDVDVIYRALDLYVLASYREGFPRSAMEAAAMGLPIVATNIRGCRQVVDHDVTGLLVPPRDAQALAEAIEVLAGDPDRRTRMGEAASVKARHEFDQDRVIDVTLETYHRLLDQQARHGRIGEPT